MLGEDKPRVLYKLDVLPSRVFPDEGSGVVGCDWCAVVCDGGNCGEFEDGEGRAL